MKSKWRSPQTVGKAFEQRICANLDALGLQYTKENMARPQGVGKVGRGKFDFEIEHPAVCIEAKSVATNTNLTLPPMKSPKIKPHQLGALRRARDEGKKAGFLIEYRHIGKVYWLSIEALHEIHCEYGLVASITPLHCDRYGEVVESIEEGVSFDVGRILAE